MTDKSARLRSLLQVLSDGKFHSGQALGESLGISRSAVWKQLQKLEALGLEVYSVKGRGYRLPGGVELLSAEQMLAGLESEALKAVSGIDLALSTESTNRSALEACQKANAHGRVFVAEQQTAGRGRRGRTWVSPFGTSLYFSMVWRFEQGMQGLDGLSLLVGLCVHQAIAAQGGEQAVLKWPNDVLCDGKKLAGILLEVHGEPGGQCQVVIGIGINVSLSERVTEDIDQPWTDLRSLNGGSVSKNQLASDLINALAKALPAFEVSGFEPWRAQWQALNGFANEPVRLLMGNRVEQGVCRGVDNSGALLIENALGTKAYHAGEVSLRADA